MKPALRWTLLLTLGMTLVAVFLDEPEDAATAVQPASRDSMAAAAVGATQGHAIQPVDRVAVVRLRPAGPNLFAVREVRAPHVVKKAPPPPPTAPPLPFRYQGKVVDDGQVTAFLAEGARTHIVREGDRLLSYLVEEINPAGMTLVYLPLNEKQPLLFGAPSR